MMAFNGTSYFRTACLLILTPQCYDEFFVKFNFLHVPCLEAALSKGLGYGIVLGSIMVKLPQIFKIWRARSGAGISLLGTTLDLTAITSNAVYSFVLGYPFSAWGESLFLAVQTAAIPILVLYFRDRLGGALAFAATFIAIVSVLLSGFTPVTVLTFLQSLSLPIVILGKSIQIHSNYRAGSTGQLSAATVMMLFAGSVVRIFTSIKETGDYMLVLIYMVTTVLNGITAAQVLYYWNATAPGSKKVKAN